MTQFIVELLNKESRDYAMISLDAIARSNNEDLLFYSSKEFNELQNQKLSLEDSINRIESEKASFEEKYNNLKSYLSKIQTEYNVLQKEYEKIMGVNSQLSSENKKYLEDLKKFSIEYNSNSKSSEIHYFNPLDGHLEECVQYDAMYIATQEGSFYNFQYNEERAKHKVALEMKDSYISPFCDIILCSGRNANYIENQGSGKFSIQGGIFNLLEKAKVAIVSK